MTWLSSQHVEIAGIRISVLSLIAAVAILVFGLLLASLVSAKVRGKLGSSAAKQRWRGTLAPVTAYAIRIAAIVLALEVAGVNLGTLVAASAVVAVGIGIAMQKVAENFVSGVILMAERSIREGDIIEFEGRVARVRQMGIRATIVETLDSEEIIVPNSILAQSAVKNLTLTEPTYRLRVRVGVAYSTDVPLAEKVLRETAEAVPWRDRGHAPIVLLVDFGPSSIDFEVSVWTNDVWHLRRGQSDLRRALWEAFRVAGISLPFPQLDVHLDRGGPPAST